MESKKFQFLFLFFLLFQRLKELIKKLKFKYNPEDFDNPALRTHLRNIEMLALDEEVKYDLEGQRITGVKDYTEPEVSGMERKAGRLIKEFQELVYPTGYNPLSGTVKKRAYDSEGAATKRGPAAAKTTGPLGTSAVDIAQAAEDGNLKKYTVLVLKEVRQIFIFIPLFFLKLFFF
jgi:ATP-dependent DNA helicase 2 subunit 1